MNALYFLAAIVMAFISVAYGSSIFDLFLGSAQRGSRSNHGRRPKSRIYPSGGGYNDYKRICRTINPDPYAFIGSNPYPAAPFCPP